MLCITNFSQIIVCLNCFLGLYEICISRSANKQRVDCGRAVWGIDHTTRIRGSSISGLGRQRVNEDTLATHKVFSNPLGLLRITPGIWVDAGLRDFFFSLKEKIHKLPFSPWTWSLHLITARDWAWKLETLLWLACDCIFNSGLEGSPDLCQKSITTFVFAPTVSANSDQKHTDQLFRGIHRGFF